VSASQYLVTSYSLEQLVVPTTSTSIVFGRGYVRCSHFVERELVTIAVKIRQYQSKDPNRAIQARNNKEVHS
jgi:hypothetical protein